MSCHKLQERYQNISSGCCQKANIGLSCFYAKLFPNAINSDYHGMGVAYFSFEKIGGPITYLVKVKNLQNEPVSGELYNGLVGSNGIFLGQLNPFQRQSYCSKVKNSTGDEFVTVYKYFTNGILEDTNGYIATQLLRNNVQVNIVTQLQLAPEAWGQLIYDNPCCSKKREKKEYCRCQYKH